MIFFMEYSLSEEITDLLCDWERKEESHHYHYDACKSDIVIVREVGFVEGFGPDWNWFWRETIQDAFDYLRHVLGSWSVFEVSNDIGITSYEINLCLICNIGNNCNNLVIVIVADVGVAGVEEGRTGMESCKRPLQVSLKRLSTCPIWIIAHFRGWMQISQVGYSIARFVDEHFVSADDLLFALIVLHVFRP